MHEIHPHFCPSCEKPVVRVKRDSGAWVCDEEPGPDGLLFRHWCGTPGAREQGLTGFDIPVSMECICGELVLRWPNGTKTGNGRWDEVQPHACGGHQTPPTPSEPTKGSETQAAPVPLPPARPVQRKGRTVRRLT